MSEGTELPGVDLESASEFVRASGFVVEEASGSRVAGYVELSEQHHTPWGVVHGGVYASVVESAASIGASAAALPAQQFAVGVHNSTDFLRASKGGRANVLAEPIQQGRVQQLWLVVITDEASGKALARGQVRLQNVTLPGPS